MSQPTPIYLQLQQKFCLIVLMEISNPMDVHNQFKFSADAFSRIVFISSNLLFLRMSEGSSCRQTIAKTRQN